jgi:L-threonylcarbamoyladenylate synthase
VAHVPSWRLPADAGGYASRLYAALREADRAGVRRLLVVPPADGPLIEAVLDRLSKAAAPRPAP